MEVLRPPAGEVPARAEEERAFVAARPEWGPPFQLRQLDSPAAVDRLDGPPDGGDLIDAWAWIDEDAGLVRARVFVDLHGIPEERGHRGRRPPSWRPRSGGRSRSARAAAR